jgi:acetylornithine deacetylase
MTSTEQRVLASIDPDETVELLRALVRAPSENPPGGESLVAGILADFLRAARLEPRLHEVEPGRANLVATLDGGQAGPTLMFNGHLDTMPAGPGWTVDPHGAEVRDCRVFGLGAADQKSGLAAMAVAAKALRRADVSPHGRLLVTGVIDEEGHGLGARKLMEHGTRADWAVITEPTELGLVRAGNGQINFEVTVRGEAAHGSTPEAGRNAIDGAARLVVALQEETRRLGARRHPLSGPTTLNVGTIHGGLVTSIVPAECRVTLDRRVIPGETVEQAIAEFDALLERRRAEDTALDFERRVVMAVPPIDVPEDAVLCQVMRRAIAAEFGIDPGFAGMRGTTDAATFEAAGIPTLIFGPGSLTKEAHRADESVPLAQVHTAARVLALTAVRFLA